MKSLLRFLLWLVPSLAGACPVCRPRVEAGIHNAAYATNVLLVLLPVALLLAGGVGLFYWDKLTARWALAHAAPN